MPKHEPTKMIYFRRSNRKHAHNTKRGVRYRNHWFKVYQCPVCGKFGSHQRQPIICKGDTPEETV